MATPFNQGVSATPVLLNSSNVFVFGNTSTGNALSVQQLGAGNVFSFSNASGRSNVFVMNNLGQLGIGQTSPASGMILDVRNTTGLVGDEKLGSTSGNQSNVIVQIGNGSSSFFGGLKIIGTRSANGSDFTTSTLRIQKYVDVTQMGYMEFGAPGGSTDIAFGTGGTTERMRITAGGNVGIGTASPGSVLHATCNISTATTIATFENSNVTTTTAKSFKLQFYGNGAGGQKDLGSINIIPTDGNFGYNDMAFSIRGPFGAGSTEAVAEVMRFSRSVTTPCVGIGTATPASTLEVCGTGFIPSTLTRTNADSNFGIATQYSLISATGSFRGNYARVYGGSAGAPATSAQSQANGYLGLEVANAGVFASDSAGYSGAQFYVANTKCVFNTSVGIGGSPGYTLDVNGTVNLTGLRVSGGVGGNSTGNGAYLRGAGTTGSVTWGAIQDFYYTAGTIPTGSWTNIVAQSTLGTAGIKNAFVHVRMFGAWWGTIQTIADSGYAGYPTFVSNSPCYQSGFEVRFSGGYLQILQNSGSNAGMDIIITKIGW